MRIQEVCMLSQGADALSLSVLPTDYRACQEDEKLVGYVLISITEKVVQSTRGPSTVSVAMPEPRVRGNP